jgi:hypothetical protein
MLVAQVVNGESRTEARMFAILGLMEYNAWALEIVQRGSKGVRNMSKVGITEHVGLVNPGHENDVRETPHTPLKIRNIEEALVPHSYVHLGSPAALAYHDQLYYVGMLEDEATDTLIEFVSNLLEKSRESPGYSTSSSIVLENNSGLNLE